MVDWFILRLWALLLLEVATFSGTAGALFASARTYRSQLVGAGLHSPAPRTASAQNTDSDLLFPTSYLPVAESAVGTYMGMDDQILLNRLKSGEVKTLKFNRGGSSVSFRIEFKDGGRAAFKPTQINPQSVPRKEVASYRLNKLLGLNLIAPAILRSFTKEDILGRLSGESAFMRPRVEAETIFENGATVGVLQHWIPSILNLGLDTTEGINRWTDWLTIGTPIPADKLTLMAQLSTLLAFDLVQNNSDRFSGGNLMGAPDGKTLFYMDNAFGFQVDPEGHPRCRSYLSRAQKFSRRFVQALQQLDKATLTKTMNDTMTDGGAPLLSEAEIDALLSRRNLALKYINGLIDHYGEDRVLVFP